MVGGRPIPDAEEAARSDAIIAELARLRDTVETLTQRLRMMVETQATHTEMLPTQAMCEVLGVSRSGYYLPVAIPGSVPFPTAYPHIPRQELDGKSSPPPPGA